jgi:hypothetical protein
MLFEFAARSCRVLNRETSRAVDNGRRAFDHVAEPRRLGRSMDDVLRKRPA